VIGISLFWNYIWKKMLKPRRVKRSSPLDVLKKCGFFYDSQTLKKGEIKVLSAWALCGFYDMKHYDLAGGLTR
jgi:hypothetical protein